MEISNFTLLEFINQPKELIEEYMICLRYLRPSETVNPVIHLKLKEVEQIKQTLNSGIDEDLIEIVSIVQGIKPKKVLDLKIIEFFGIVNSVKNQLERIIKAEEKGLTPSHIDQKWEQVRGSERMQKFGIYNTLDNLTGKKPHLYETYMNMSYSEIFTILLKWKEESDIQHEMNQIKSK